MKKLILMRFLWSIAMCLFFQTLFSQVGVGTTDPTAELEIETTPTGIPALEINPQTAPTGNTTGQLAVIGDQLCMYDETRGKWLSVESTALHFARGGSNRNDSPLRFSGVISNQNSGAHMPMDGTIVYISAMVNGGDTSKEFFIERRDASGFLSTAAAFNLSSGTYSNSAADIDFNAGEYLITRISGTGGTVNNPNIILWVKWRH